MATPVVTVASGGMPVVDVTATSPKLGLPVTEALNGRGTPVTKVAARGMPVTYSTVADYPPSGGSASAEASQWLARATGLNALHIAADTAMIDGLVADGVWVKLDVIRMYATQNQATALRNMRSNNYNATAVGAPTFTVDQGFTGVENSATVYIDSNFNPVTAVSPQYTQNSCHMSVYNMTDAAFTVPAIGSQVGTSQALIITKHSSNNNTYYLMQVSGGGNAGVFSPINAHIGGNRQDLNQVRGYLNGVERYFGALSSTPVNNQNFYELGSNQNGVAIGCGTRQVAVTWGASLTATDWANLNTRLVARLTAVGVS